MHKVYKLQYTALFLAITCFTDYRFALECQANPLVPQHQIFELTIHAEPPNGYNPSITYPFKLRLTDPDGDDRIIDAFYDGPSDGRVDRHNWKARICPEKHGRWYWEIIPGDISTSSSAYGTAGSFLCIAGRDPGGLIAEGSYFKLQNDGLTYLQGNFLDFRNGLVSTHVLLSNGLQPDERQRILDQQQDFHKANKVNIYLANRGDYNGISVIPWKKEFLDQGQMVFDLDFWHQADQLMTELKQRGFFAEIWFFADDSDFGQMPMEQKKLFFRYAMARLSSFSHAFFVIALEWNEEWSQEDVNTSGKFIQQYNPWNRLLSVHSLEIFPQGNLVSYAKRMIRKNNLWPFQKMKWPTFISSQAGNSSTISQVNELALLLNQERIPHLSEEFGYLTVKNDPQLRGKMWANFCGGAAGGGTGSDIAQFLSFMEMYNPPIDRMSPQNDLIEGGGHTRFCLAEVNHTYIAYSLGGNFNLTISGTDLKGYWFNPRTGNQEGLAFTVDPYKMMAFVPPTMDDDWVLWISEKKPSKRMILRPSRLVSTISYQVN